MGYTIASIFQPCDVPAFKNSREKHKYLHRFNGELYPKEISRRMLTTGSLILICTPVALYWQCYALAFASFVVFVASINYWRKPTRGIRRNIDMVTSVSSVLFH